MSAFFLELKYAFRSLAKSAGFTVLAVVMLSFGIGSTIFMFTAVKANLLEPLPFEEGNRIMHLERNNLSRGWQSMEVTHHDFVDWRAQQT
ncbi:MAG: ABC transporter permease, partial [Gammaproteobacteria bacterium]|nr:ABC transporter permease [Gammaproteobacteria bacterium]